MIRRSYATLFSINKVWTIVKVFLYNCQDFFRRHYARGQASAPPAHGGVLRDQARCALAPGALRRDPLTHLSLDDEVVDDRLDALLQLAPGITVSGELPEQSLLE